MKRITAQIELEWLIQIVKRTQKVEKREYKSYWTLRLKHAEFTTLLLNFSWSTA